MQQKGLAEGTGILDIVARLCVVRITTLFSLSKTKTAHGVVEISKSWLHAEITDVSNAALEFRMVVRIWRVPTGQIKQIIYMKT